ncbi:MAG: hypothetical protein SGILL_007154, partial [Bacillariaceae sp.]
PSGDDDKSVASSLDGEDMSDDKTSMFVVSCVMVIPLVAVIYYFKQAWDQRERLEKLDREPREAV